MSVPKAEGHKRCLLGVFKGERLASENGQYQRERIFLNIRCGRWDCPRCGPKKAKKVYKRALHGGIWAAAQAEDGKRSYNFKLVTLTYGGNLKRAGSSPSKAVREMSESFSKLIEALKKLRGDFQYIRVFERHKDGWPHIHLLICGENIADKGVYADLTRLWRYKYHFGFIRVNWAETPKKALAYILKYLFKCVAYFRKTRIFSGSRGALERIVKVRHVWLYRDICWTSTVAMMLGLDPGFEVEWHKTVVEVMPLSGVPF